MKKMILYITVILLGCAQAQFIRETKDEGRVLITGYKYDDSAALKEAEKKIKVKCKNGFKITEKGKIKTGSQDYNYSVGGSSSVDTMDTYFDFKCK